MKKLFPIIPLIGIALSCSQLVDESYDLKKVDPEITVGGGLTVDLPDKDFSLSLKEVLDGTSQITADASGNYRLNLPQVRENLEYGIPAINIPKITEVLNIVLDRYDAGGLAASTPLEGSFNHSKNGEIPISVEYGSFPAEITAIKSARLAGKLTISIVPSTLAGAEFYLRPGSTITLPDFLGGIADAGNGAAFRIDGNIISVLSETEITSGLNLSYTFSEINSVPGVNPLPAPGQLKIDGKVKYNAQVRIAYSGTVGAYSAFVPEIDGDVTLDNLQFNNVEVMIDKQLSASSLPSVAIGQMPEALSAEGSVLDLHDLAVPLKLNSDLPCPLSVKAQVSSLAADGRVLKNYPIGSFAIQTGGGTYTANEGNCPGISDILIPIPAKISVSRLEATLKTSSHAVIETGRTYSAAASLAIDSPLSFGAGARIEGITYEVSDLGLGNADNISFSQATLKISYINSIPLNFLLKGRALSAEGIDIQLLDANGEPLASSPVSIAYAPDSPAETSIKLKGDKIKLQDFLGIAFTISASSSGELAGRQLNANQAFEIVGMKVILDSGITIGGNK